MLLSSRLSMFADFCVSNVSVSVGELNGIEFGHGFKVRGDKKIVLPNVRSNFAKRIYIYIYIYNNRH